MKIIKDYKISETTFNLTVSPFMIDDEVFTIVSQVEFFNNMVKKINFVTIENDLPIEFDEIESDVIKDNMMDLFNEFAYNI